MVNLMIDLRDSSMANSMVNLIVNLTVNVMVNAVAIMANFRVSIAVCINNKRELYQGSLSYSCSQIRIYFS